VQSLKPMIKLVLLSSNEHVHKKLQQAPQQNKFSHGSMDKSTDFYLEKHSKPQVCYRKDNEEKGNIVERRQPLIDLHRIIVYALVTALY
jgi:hypothetical protein